MRRLKFALALSALMLLIGRRRSRRREARLCRRNIGQHRGVRRQFPRRRHPGGRGDQRQEAAFSRRRSRSPNGHPDQSRRRPLADAEGDRRRSLCHPRADLLRQRQGHHAAGEAGGNPAIHRRRGGRADHLGQSVHVPDLVRPADRHAEDRQLHPRRAQGEDDRADLGEQRLRQGRPRPADEGNGRAQHQDRRRRLDRIRRRPISPPTSSSSSRRMPTQSSSTATRRNARASCARRASRG